MAIRSGSGFRSGQAMLIAILTIGGAILGATTIAGFLTLYQIRATTDSENSAKAIFAADTGVNWVLYTRLTGSLDPLPTPLGDAATIYVRCYDSTGAVLAGNEDGCEVLNAATEFSRGQSLNSLRAFTLSLANPTSTAP